MRQPSLAVLLCLVLLVVPGCEASGPYQPRDGDIIFHTSRSAQSLAIQKATGSRYSHMGIVYIEDGVPCVFEAVEPVKLTPLADWIARGEDGHYVVKRLIAADEVLTAEALQRMLAAGKELEGRHYDLYFEWSDDRIYCSELVWKIYHRGLGLEIGRLRTISDFDLSDPVVQAKVQERYGGPPPADGIVISPADIFDSELLTTVHSH